MKADNFDTPTNPYHYVLHCIGGKWKKTILHEIYTYGSIRFNQTLKILPISEKVFSQQLKELVEAGLIRRISYDTVPPKVEYVLTPSGEQLIPALDILYIWSIRQMHDRRIPIDADAFVVHKSEKYVDALGDIMRENNFWPGRERRRGVEQGAEETNIALLEGIIRKRAAEAVRFCVVVTKKLVLPCQEIRSKL